MRCVVRFMWFVMSLLLLFFVFVLVDQSIILALIIQATTNLVLKHVKIDAFFREMLHL